MENSGAPSLGGNSACDLLLNDNIYLTYHEKTTDREITKNLTTFPREKSMRE